MDDVMKETLNVAGLLTNVYARSNNSNSSEPIVVLFFLHGRGESADTVDSTARAAFAWVDEKRASYLKRSAPPRDFMVVTFVRGFLRAGLAAQDDDHDLRNGSTGSAESWPEDSGQTREPGLES